VAQFFRGCNVIEAKIEATGDQKVSVSFGGITVEVSVTDVSSLKPGPAAVAIRAENLRLQALKNEFPASLEAQLMEIVYRGTIIDYLLELKDGQKAVATATRKHTHTSHEKVKVSFNPENVIILRD
jgi:ABC-type Fe3+/spermidine/putrescine transport system ATPase subunit